ncbi:MAG: hypothetical protein KDA51_00975, partial [Planctomycetales bacterium]|nr:hypothetical protein [Planctomycetales bacterium]
FGDYASEYSFDYALENGLVVNVTSWVQREMGFGRSRYRIRVAVTARLWQSIVTVAPLARVWQTVTGRGSDVLWLASYALQKARRYGAETAKFDCFLPTEDDFGTDCIQPLCVKAGEERGKPYIVIGHAEEFAII